MNCIFSEWRICDAEMKPRNAGTGWRIGTKYSSSRVITQMLVQTENVAITLFNVGLGRERPGTP